MNLWRFHRGRWYYVFEHAYWSRKWIAGLPRDVGENIAYRNAEALATTVC